MANSLFKEFGNQNNNLMSQLLTDARELKKTIQNPRAEVERLLQTGAMSQKTFNELSQIANQVVRFIDD